MLLIIGIACVIAFVVSPTVRCAVSHPILLSVYGFRDIWQYISRKSYNFCGSGELVGYIGLFGRGKTLSAVHKVTSTYRHYDGKPVWCPRRRKIVTQRVHVISNVALKIPYEELRSLQQIVDAAKRQQAQDDEQDTLTVTLVLGDEFSVQMNSRNFRTNIDPLFLNTILTCRHYYISLYYTAQRFGHVDALLRQVTSYVVSCDKLWRFQRLSSYDAWDMENCSNVSLLRPFARSCWFVRDDDYKAYNTLAVVENLQHRVQDNEMMSPTEILDLQRNQSSDMDAVKHPSRKWRRRENTSRKR
jgi:hypothetical protein